MLNIIKLADLKKLSTKGNKPKKIKNTTWSSNKLNESLKKFKCKKDKDIEKWIRKDAYNHVDAASKVPTYLLISPSGSEILGYFTMKNKPIHIWSLPEDFQKHYKKGDGSITQMFITHIGREDDTSKDRVNLHQIFLLIYLMITNMEFSYKLIGLDCKAELKPLYEKYGFKEVGYDKSNKLHWMTQRFDSFEMMFKD